MKKYFKIICSIFFGVFLLAAGHVRADIGACTAGATVYCKLPDGTCKSSSLSAATASDPLALCITFGATWVDCGAASPAGCPASPAAPASTPAAGGTAAASKPLFVPDWNQADCTKAGGDWIPDAGKTSGPYCYAKQDISYTPSISIGGATIKNLGDYVAQAYNYALGFVLMIAIIMVMIGGVQYIMARGGSGVGAAKKRIGNAILGVILLFAAYLILNTVSPSLVKLSLPRVPLLKQNKFAFSEVANCGGYKDATTCTQNAVGMNRGYSTCYVGQQSVTANGCAWDAASKTCVMAPPPVAGGLNSQCPDKKCVEGLWCVTALATGNCYICTDGKRGSACGSGDDCKDPTASTCDSNTKQCIGDTMRPIGADCDKDEQCANGSCYKAHCGSSKIGLACTGDQYRPQDVYPKFIVDDPSAYGALGLSKEDMQACRPPSYDGQPCLLSVTCQSGKCDQDNINRNAQKISDLAAGKCISRGQ